MDTRSRDFLEGAGAREIEHFLEIFKIQVDEALGKMTKNSVTLT